LFGLASEEWQDLVLSVGTHRGQRRISPVQVALLLRRALDNANDVEQLAKALHFQDRTMVSRFLSLLKLPEEYQELVGWGKRDGLVSFTSAALVSSLSDKQKIRDALEVVLMHDLTKVETEALVQRVRRSEGTKTVRDAVSEVLRMRPRVETRYLIVGAVKEVTLTSRLSKMDQWTRDRIWRKILHDNFPEVQIHASASRLTPKMFFITTDAEGRKRLLQHATDSATLEEIVRQILISSLGG